MKFAGVNPWLFDLFIRKAVLLCCDTSSELKIFLSLSWQCFTCFNRLVLSAGDMATLTSNCRSLATINARVEFPLSSSVKWAEAVSVSKVQKMVNLAFCSLWQF